MCVDTESGFRQASAMSTTDGSQEKQTSPLWSIVIRN